jgi:hypothetical protein
MGSLQASSSQMFFVVTYMDLGVRVTWEDVSFEFAAPRACIFYILK